MKVLFVLLVTSIFCLRASAASISTTVQFVSLPGTPGNAPGNFMNNTYNGYLGVYIGGSSSLSQIICDDFSDHTNVPSGPFDYFATTIDEVGQAGSPTLFGSTLNYEAAAILANDILGMTGTDAVSEDNVTMDQYAIWSLTSASTPVFAANGTNSSDVASAALAAALASPNNPLYSELTIYTPQVLGSNQEFLGLAPEPSSIFLFLAGAGLMAIGVYRSRLVNLKS